MTAAEQKLHAQADRLRKQLAAAESNAEHLRNKLAALDSKLSGAPAPVFGLDLLWRAALPTARIRSSKIQCRTEWNRIPKAERPTVETAVQALKSWNRCHEWKKDGNQFAPALHRFIKNRMWEDLPEGQGDPLSRYKNTRKPLPQVAPGDEVTDPAEIAKILSINPRRMNS